MKCTVIHYRHIAHYQRQHVYTPNTSNYKLCTTRYRRHVTHLTLKTADYRLNPTYYTLYNVTVQFKLYTAQFLQLPYYPNPIYHYCFEPHSFIIFSILCIFHGICKINFITVIFPPANKTLCLVTKLLYHFSFQAAQTGLCENCGLSKFVA